MNVTIEKDGYPVCIFEGVSNFHTVLAIKEAIERNLHIPVYRQTLFFEGRVLHNDHLQVGQCNIVHNSRLQLFVSSNPYQVRHQTQQSPALSNVTQQSIPYHQDWSVMMRRSNNNESLPSNLTQQSIPYHQYWPPGMMMRSNNIEPLPSNLTQQSIPYHQDWPPVTGGSSRNRNQVVQPEKYPVTSRNLHGQSFWPQTTQKRSKVQDSPVMVRNKNNQVRSNKNESRSLSATEGLLGIQDCCPLPVGLVKLIVENHNGSSFSIDVDFWDTMLTIKHKIEKSQGTPVFKQTLSLQGKFLHDHLTIFDCQIPNDSRLLLSICPDDNLNQNNNDQVPQTKQSPSNPFHKFVKNQDWSMSKNQHNRPVTNQNKVTNESLRPPSPLDGSSGPQNLQSVRVGSRRNRNQVVKTEQSSLDELLGTQDNLQSVRVGSRRNRNQTEQSSPSESVKDFLRLIDSPVQKKIKTDPTKLTVMVQPSWETKKFPVEVNASDEITILRKELVKMQEKGELNLPHQGYFFFHKKSPLPESTTFSWWGIADGDTIKISP